jgi:Rrf2 family protein
LALRFHVPTDFVVEIVPNQSYILLRRNLMLCLSKKTEYALIALGYLAERPGQVASAREIGHAFNLPLPLLMNILKVLNRNDLLTSSRGIRGGYQVGQALLSASLYDLISILDGDQPLKPLVEVHQDDSGEEHRPLSNHAPVQALNVRLAKFLDDAKLVDLVMPKNRRRNESAALAVGAMA